MKRGLSRVLILPIVNALNALLESIIYDEQKAHITKTEHTATEGETHREDATASLFIVRFDRLA